jgi:membrane-bound inhibitor of C-type lysozyme
VERIAMPSRYFILIINFLGLLFLAACEQETVSSSRYICAGNKWIETTFKDGKSVEIETEGEVIVLPRVESASGAKYELDDMMFWSKGRDAQFTEKPGMQPISCQRR